MFRRSRASSRQATAGRARHRAERRRWIAEVDVDDSRRSAEIDGGRFPTTPGATYEFTVRMRSTWSPGAPAAGYVGIAFFSDGTEVERPNIRIEPVPFEVGTSTTDDAGHYAIVLEGAEPGSEYLVTVHTPGDLTTWPSKATTIVGG